MEPPTHDTPFEVVYDLVHEMGFSVYGLPGRAIHVTDQFVYWSKSARLMQAPKDGNGPVVEIAQLNRLGLSRLRSDADHLYWINDDKLVRRLHGNGEPEQITLPWDHTGGDFKVDVRYVYVTMPGCPSLIRLDKTTLEQEILYASVERPAPTALLLHDGEIFCGGGGKVFRVRDWATGMELFATHPERVYTLAHHDGYLYWYGNPGVLSSPSYIWRAPLSHSGTTPIEAERMSVGGAFANDWTTDGRGTWVYATANHLAVGNLLAYIPSTDALRVLSMRGGTGGGVDSDGRHYYLTHWGKCCVNHQIDPSCPELCCDDCGAILRFSVDAPLHEIPGLEQ